MSDLRGCLAKHERSQLPAMRITYPQCALPTPNGLVCGTCLQHPPAFDRTFSVFRYAFPVNRCLQQFKYAQQLAFGECLMRLALTALAKQVQVRDALASPSASVMIAMPMHRDRLQARGFHHADYLAQMVAKQ